MDNNFMDFVFSTEKAAADPAPAPADATVDPTGPETVTWREMGDAIAAAIPGFGPTKDVYGNGPEAHGAAYKVSGDQKDAIKTLLESLGFTLKGAYSWYADNLRVDIGVNKGTTYCYLTDDAGKKAKELDLTDDQLGRASYKHLPGEHAQETHGDRETGPTSKFGPVDQFMSDIKTKGWGENGVTWSGSQSDGYTITGRISKVAEMRVTIPASVIKKGNYPLITGVTTGIYREGKPVVEWEGMRPIYSMAAYKVSRGTGEIKWGPEERYGEYNYKFIPKSEKEITLKHLPGQHDQATHGDRGAAAGGRAFNPNLRGGRIGEITSNANERIRLTKVVDRENKKGNTPAFQKALADLEAFDKDGGVFKKKPSTVVTNPKTGDRYMKAHARIQAKVGESRKVTINPHDGNVVVGGIPSGLYLNEKHNVVDMTGKPVPSSKWESAINGPEKKPNKIPANQLPARPMKLKREAPKVAQTVDRRNTEKKPSNHYMPAKLNTAFGKKPETASEFAKRAAKLEKKRKVASND